MRIGDFDRDGHVDCAVSNTHNSGGFGGSIAIVLIRFDGESITYERSDYTELGLSNPTAMDIGDIDGDGDLDIVCSSVKEGVDWVAPLIQDADGHFFAAPIIAGDDFLAGIEQPFVADLDGDQELDVLTNNNASDTLTILWGGH